MNNWSADMLPRHAKRYTNAMQAYELYQHSHNPKTPPGQYWFQFYRNGFPFFVLDTRTERRDGQYLLGPQQMNQFKDWLFENRNSPVRFIGTSIAFFPGQRRSHDGWKAFDHQRGEILDYIRKESGGPVVFLGGDYHCSSISVMKSPGNSDFQVASVISSPLFWPYGYGRRKDFFEKRTLSYPNLPDHPVFEYSLQAFRGEENYVVISVSDAEPANVRVQICSKHGAVLEDRSL